MQLTSIAMNNLRRRKAKAAFLLVGMLIGIATITGLYSITTAMEVEIGNKFDQIGANMLVTPKSDALTLSYQGVPVTGVAIDMKELDDSAIPKIRSIKNKENISVIAPKLVGGVTVEGRKALVIGVNFPAELTLKKWWKLNTDPQNPEQYVEKAWRSLKLADDEVVLGATVAAKTGKKPGDNLQVNGQKFRVGAVLQPMGMEEDKAVLMELPKAQQLLGKPGKLSMIELAALCNTCPIEDIVAQINAAVPHTEVKAIKEAVEARKAVVDKFSHFAMAISLVVFFIGCLIVMMAMMGSVNERVREIGIFRAIGFRKAHVGQIILTEAFVLSVIGGVLGYALGILIAKSMAPMIAQMDVIINWSWPLGIGSVLVAITVGMLASAYPAWKAANLDPAEALRFI